MMISAASGRKCPACNNVEAVPAGEPIWPLGWRCAACGHVIDERDGIAMFAPGLADTAHGMDPGAFETLARIEVDHFWFAARRELLVGLARKYFPAARGFLEIGCGTGAVLEAMARSRAWERLAGSELHPSGLTYARHRLPPDVELVQMDARQIAAVDLFDLTGAFDVLEHIPDDEGVLLGLRRATARGGGVIISVPQHPWLWSRADEVAHHVRRYRRGELEAKLRRNGFEVLFSSSFTALLLPLMAASRLSRRDAPADDAYEFRMNATANRVLLGILRAETFMTLAGFRWPAGGSRIVVGRAI